MKRILTTTALVLSLTGAATASVTDQLKNSVAGKLSVMPLDANVEAMTDEQVIALSLILNSSMSAIERQSAVISITNNDFGSVPMIDMDMVDRVNTELDIMGIEADFAALEADDIRMIDQTLSMGGSPLEKSSKVESILLNAEAKPAVEPNYLELTSVRELVGAKLDIMGIEADVAELSDDQVTALQLALNSGTAGEQISKANAILQ